MTEEDRIVEGFYEKARKIDGAVVSEHRISACLGCHTNALRAAIRETARACENAVEFQGSEKAHPLRIVHTFKSRIPDLFPEAFEDQP